MARATVTLGRVSSLSFTKHIALLAERKSKALLLLAEPGPSSRVIDCLLCSQNFLLPKRRIGSECEAEGASAYPCSLIGSPKAIPSSLQQRLGLCSGAVGALGSSLGPCGNCTLPHLVSTFELYFGTYKVLQRIVIL